MNERMIVNRIVEDLQAKGYKVKTEVANFYRSADIAVIDNEENIWIIECKVSSIGQAINQLKTHKLSADKVFIGTLYRNTKESTLNKIKEAGIGLIYVMTDGSINKVIEEPNESNPWAPARERLLHRIIGGK